MTQTTASAFFQANSAPYGRNSNASMFVKQDSSLVDSYTAGSLAFTPVATPTDIVLITGSASKTVRIKRLTLQGVATAAGNMPIQLIRRSTPYTTSGSAVLTALTAAAKDINNPAVTATVQTVGTANFTSVGTAVATVATGRVQMAASGTGVAFVPLLFDFTDDAVVLRGTSDILAINCNGAAVPSGGVIDFFIEWEEDNS